MKETKQASVSPEARAAMHEMMAAFEAFKGANDARLDEIERKSSADALLEEKVARIDQAVSQAQARLDRVVSEARRPVLGGVESPSTASRSPSPFHGEEKAAFDGYIRTGAGFGLELKAGLSSAPSSGGYVVPPETERAIERRLMAVSPMREIATVRTVGAGVFRKPVSTAGVASGWVAETAARPATQPGQLASLLGYPVTEIETMPDIAANSAAIAFGDFQRGYLIVDRAGVRVLRDPYSAKPYVLFYTTKRVGGGVQNFDAIKVMKFAAT